MTTSSSGSSESSATDHPSRRRRALPRWAATLAWCALAFVGGAAVTEAYVRITLGGKTLYHADPQIEFRLNPGSFPELDAEALRSTTEIAFSHWNSVSSSALEFTRGAETASMDWADLDSHLIYRDPNNGSGYFPGWSNVVAVTPIQYSTGNGRILDVDVIFNGRDFQFRTRAESASGYFDVQDVLTHELGHAAGLDHSPVHGSSLWPYVRMGEWMHRSLTRDDMAGAVAAARSGGISLLRGTLLHDDGSPIRGGGVAAIRADDGRLAATALSASNGVWVIKGIPAGPYHVYSFPLEGAMVGGDLVSDVVPQTDFGPAFYGGYANPGQFQLGNGQSLDLGTLRAAPDGDARDVFGHARTLQPGVTQTIAVPGSGFGSAPGSFELFSPWLTVADVVWDDTQVYAQVTVQPGCPVGSYDVFLQRADGELEVVPGAIEVVDPPPVIDSVDVVEGDISGGTEVVVHGSGFQDGAWVLVGGRVAADIQLLDAERLGIRTPPGDGGDVDVVVQNPDGQESVLEDGFCYTAIPRYDSLFPRAGSVAGGTRLRVTGSGFIDGMSVTVGGTPADLSILSKSVIEIVTPPAPDEGGTVDIVMTSAEGVDSVYEKIYTYVEAPDPDIDELTPESGRKSGGTEVRLFGDNLPEGAKVRFGVDLLTGQGGRYAGGVDRVSAAELRSVTPGGQPGQYGVAVELPNGQGALADTAFTYEPAPAAGGCGGVVHGAQPGQPRDWLPALALGLLWRMLTRRRPAPRIVERSGAPRR